MPGRKAGLPVSAPTRGLRRRRVCRGCVVAFGGGELAEEGGEAELTGIVELLVTSRKGRGRGEALTFP